MDVSELTSTRSTCFFLLSHCTKAVQAVWAFFCGVSPTDRRTAFGKHQVESSQRPATQTCSRLFLRQSIQTLFRHKFLKLLQVRQATFLFSLSRCCDSVTTVELSWYYSTNTPALLVLHSQQSLRIVTANAGESSNKTNPDQIMIITCHQCHWTSLFHTSDRLGQFIFNENNSTWLVNSVNI